MTLLKSALFVFVAASMVFVGEISAEAQSRTTHHNRQGTSGGGGTQMQSSIQSAQNQARSIAARQHQIWLAHRLKKNAAEKAAKANAAETKAAAKSTEPDKTSSAEEPTTKATSTPATKTTK